MHAMSRTAGGSRVECTVANTENICRKIREPKYQKRYAVSKFYNLLLFII